MFYQVKCPEQFKWGRCGRIRAGCVRRESVWTCFARAEAAFAVRLRRCCRRAGAAAGADAVHLRTHKRAWGHEKAREIIANAREKRAYFQA